MKYIRNHFNYPVMSFIRKNIQKKTSYARKCLKIDIKIDKSILRIAIFQIFFILLFFSAQITPKTLLTSSLYVIPIDSHDESHTYIYIYMDIYIWIYTFLGQWFSFIIQKPLNV